MAPLPAWPPMLLFFNKTRVDGSGLPCFLETPPAWCFARKGFSSRGLEQVPGVTCGAERPLSLCWQPLRGLRCSLGVTVPLDTSEEQLYSGQWCEVWDPGSWHQAHLGGVVGP